MALICPEKILCIPAEEIFRHYGFEHQVGKTREEIDELLEAINGASYWWKNGMPINDESRAALLTECADVIVMCAQLLRLDAVLYPVNVEAHPKFLERLIVAYRDEVLAMGGVSLDPRLHFGRDIIEEAIRLAVSIAGKEELQEEILFKIRRQEQRVAADVAQAKIRETFAKMERAAIRAAEIEAKKAAKNAAKLTAYVTTQRTLGARHRLQIPEGCDRQVGITLIVTPPSKRRMDEDNLLANCKATLDGIAMAMKINDHLFHFREQEWHAPKKPGSLRIAFDWEEAHD